MFTKNERKKYEGKWKDRNKEVNKTNKNIKT
jgi:hypothetical protein